MLVGKFSKRHPFSWSLLVIFALASPPSLFGQDDGEPKGAAAEETLLRYRLHRARETALNQTVAKLAKAQRDADENSVKRLAEEIKQLLGDDAGSPETPD